MRESSASKAPALVSLPCSSRISKESNSFSSIHDTDGHNPHAHILLTVRPLEERGKWQYKTEKEYLCMKNGEERGFTASEFRTAQNDGWEKQYPYKVGKKQGRQKEGIYGSLCRRSTRACPG
ncbi:MAG: MobA/MobL family protein [Christensenellaceae bacterium]